MKQTKRIVILGATGSIGTQTLACIDEANKSSPESFEVVGLSAFSNLKALAELAMRYPNAGLAFLGCPSENASDVPSIPPIPGHAFFAGRDGITKLLDLVGADLVVNAIAGSAGFPASVTSLEHGCNLALANKESVVMGFSQIKRIADKKKLAIIPVDSEHAALFQLTTRIGRESITELTLTASGGPFRNTPLQELENITPDDAVRHPVWRMGRKISIDSATLANKGLELIEAVRLFDMPEDKVRILVHPESIVHALVRTKDSALYAYMSEPDMKLPIDIALYWPVEEPCLFGRLDLAGKILHFENPDARRFPMLDLAREAVRIGEAATNAYNAANEVAVSAFEEGKIRFTEIATVVEGSLSHDWSFAVADIDSIFDTDAQARIFAREVVRELSC
jgi:1-deoxy-D-xylulose-5-phosphate reductoisomerase